MLKILHVRLQQYGNRELLDVQAGFRKGRGTRDQIANIRWIMEKAREFQKNIYFCLVLKSCPILCNPVEYSLPGSSVHGIFQARKLGQLPFPTLGDLLDPGSEPWVQSSLVGADWFSAFVGGFFTTSTT